MHDCFLHEFVVGQRVGMRLVDYLDLHYYPQASGVLSANESKSVVELRYNSVRSLYDRTYVDQSWINSVIRLIPDMKARIAAHCSWMKFSISEYDFGDDSIWSAALVTAEALAIFGREGVDLATKWTVPKIGSPVENAFKLFLDYDGKRSNLYGDSVSASSGDYIHVPAYAIRSQDKSKLFVMAFNKAGSEQTLHFTLRNVQPTDKIGTTYAFGPSTGGLRLTGTVSIASNQFLAVVKTGEAFFAVIPVAGNFITS